MKQQVNLISGLSSFAQSTDFYIMRFYLDTNILYNLRHVPEALIANCYSSFLAILEIIAGINNKNYAQRRTALKNVVDAGLQIDWRTPDMIIFDSFNIYSEFTMSDSRVLELETAMHNCIVTVDYWKFIENKINDVPIVDYFKNIDIDITDKFTRTFPELIPSIKKTALTSTFVKDDVNIKVDFTEAARAAYISDNNYLMMVKHIAIGSQNIIGSSNAADKPVYPHDVVIKSYNGGVDFFICAWLKYNSNNIGIANMPGRNDFQDLLHFTYLRNHPDLKIVSNDAIFNKISKAHHLSLQQLQAALP